MFPGEDYGLQGWSLNGPCHSHPCLKAISLAAAICLEASRRLLLKSWSCREFASSSRCSSVAFCWEIVSISSLWMPRLRISVVAHTLRDFIVLLWLRIHFTSCCVTFVLWMRPDLPAAKNIWYRLFSRVANSANSVTRLSNPRRPYWVLASDLLNQPSIRILEGCQCTHQLLVLLDLSHHLPVHTLTTWASHRTVWALYITYSGFPWLSLCNLMILMWFVCIWQPSGSPRDPSGSAKDLQWWDVFSLS